LREGVDGAEAVAALLLGAASVTKLAGASLAGDGGMKSVMRRAAFGRGRLSRAGELVVLAVELAGEAGTEVAAAVDDVAAATADTSEAGNLTTPAAWWMPTSFVGAGDDGSGSEAVAAV